MSRLEYLITGATGGLGSGVVNYFLSKNVPLTNFAVSSSRASNRTIFEEKGLQFRLADYDDPESLYVAFEGGVENLFFVSSAALDTTTRVQQHRNVIEAAKRTNVGHVSNFSYSLIRNPTT